MTPPGSDVHARSLHNDLYFFHGDHQLPTSNPVDRQPHMLFVIYKPLQPPHSIWVRFFETRSSPETSARNQKLETGNQKLEMDRLDFK